jgi:DNA excision repair protein ERCC-3
LPARVFRSAADFRSTYRLGLTATLVREDGRESEAIALVGPPVYDASWSTLEEAGWIAPAVCHEVRVPPSSTEDERRRFKIAALERLLLLHRGEPALVAGTELAGLTEAGRRLGFPVLTGASPVLNRSDALDAFRSGDLMVLGISRIGTLGVDLPSASVLIQISGSFGSRQEEAQRLGRILRPSPGKQASFYTIVARGTREVRDAERRQRFLVNQGYQYRIMDAAELPRPR